jgi:AAA domain
MSLKPTAEQQAVIDAFAAGDALVVEAVAGAGKTSTLRMAAESTPGKRCLYVAFTKALQVEAKQSMPRNVVARTAHSLAFRDVGYRYKQRLDAPFMPTKAVVDIMYAGGRHPVTRVLNAPVDVGAGIPLRPTTLARHALETVKRYCYSADVELATHHVPPMDGVTGAARGALVDLVLPMAELAWADIRHPAGKLPHSGDHYLKVWALGNPHIPAACVLFDEAQDANPVLADVLMRQSGAQLVAVGDSCQQMYAWRGAVDALAAWPADQRLYLSQSFRFGPAVAARANRWLDLLNAGTRVVGAPWLDSTVGPVTAPDAVLCRTNAGAIGATIRALDAGRKVHIAGGAAEISRLAEAADQLQHGERCDHPKLVAFGSWEEVREYVAEDSSSDLGPLVKLVDEHGVEAILATVAQLVEDPRRADVVVATVHKAKGLQWPQVSIGDDFREPKPKPWPPPDSPRKAIVLERAELMGAYVAVTRAEQRLDDAGLSWVDNVRDYGLPVVVMGERLGEPVQVVKHHPEHVLLPDPPPLPELAAGLPAWLEDLGREYRPDPAERIAAVAEVAPEFVQPAPAPAGWPDVEQLLADVPLVGPPWQELEPKRPAPLKPGEYPAWMTPEERAAVSHG